MRRFCLVFGIAMSAFVALAQEAPTNGPYRVSKTVKVGGEGTFDTAFADTAGRRLYIPRKIPLNRLAKSPMLAPMGLSSISNQGTASPAANPS